MEGPMLRRRKLGSALLLWTWEGKELLAGEGKPCAFRFCPPLIGKYSRKEHDFPL